MNDLLRRRRAMMEKKSDVLDTSPKIAEYGVLWGRTQGGKTENANWCITDWYYPNPAYNSLTIVGNVGIDSSNVTFQYENESGSNKNWWYLYPGNKRTVVLNSPIFKITFSIRISEIANSYIYIEETGQILFAGKKTPYYGYTNINDMPQG